MKLSLTMTTKLAPNGHRYHSVALISSSDCGTAPDVEIDERRGIESTETGMPNPISLAESMLDDLQAEITGVRAQLKFFATPPETA